MHPVLVHLVNVSTFEWLIVVVKKYAITRVLGNITHLMGNGNAYWLTAPPHHSPHTQKAGLIEHVNQTK